MTPINATVYTRPHCMRCKATIKSLTNMGAVVSVRQLDNHPNKIEEMRHHGWQELPLVEITHNDQPIATWAGMSQTHLDETRELIKAQP